MTKTKKKPLTKQQKAVAIAKDVIKQLTLRKMVPTTGAYLNVPNIALESTKGKVTEAEVNQCLGRHCQVCAIGAVIISKLRLFDGLQRKRLAANHGSLHSALDYSCGGPGLKEFLESHFDLDSICDLEHAFEGWHDGKIWKKTFPSNSKRLIAIMKNIIRYKGRFVIKDCR